MASVPGRGREIAGWILLGTAVAGTLAVLVLSTIAAVTVVNVGMLVGLTLLSLWSIVAVVIYITGLLLLVNGRSRQRGPVLGQTWALIVAVGAPFLALLIWAIIAATSPPSFVAVLALIVSLVCLIAAPAGAAWSIWGRR
jgi:hypothetical protein